MYIIILYEILDREREKVICLYVYVFNLLVSAQHLAKASSDEACGADGTWSKLLGPTSSVNDLVIYGNMRELGVIPTHLGRTAV